MDLSEAEIFEGFGMEPPAVTEDGADVTAADDSEAEGAALEDGGEQGTQDAIEQGADGEVPADAQGVGAEDGKTADVSAGERQGQVVPPMQQYQEVQAQIDKAYADAYTGRVNPYTGRAILSKQDYDQYMQEFNAEQQRERMDELRRNGLDPDTINSLIDQHPAVKQAQQAVIEAEAAKQRAREAEATAWYGEQVKGIAAIDPTVKSLSDLSQKCPEQWPKMLDMVSRGMSLVDAYKALNFDAVVQRRTEAAVQGARNQISSKAHLAPAGGQGKAGVEVPQSVAEEFRALNPEMTDAEIRKGYADYLKLSQ